MVNVWATERTGSVVTLNTGTVVDIDSFSGNGWTVNRCANITTDIQESLLDEIVDRDSMPVDDPDKTATEAQLQATYGGWFIGLNTQGQSNEFRLRRTAFRLFPVDVNGEDVTSGSGVSFNFEFRQVRF